MKVRHILVSWSGANRSKSTLTKAEAEKKAEGLFERAKGGDNFERMMKEESEDPGPGVYTLVNKGVPPERGEHSRDGMVKGFSDASFRLKVGECALVPFDPQTSPFGWHILQRME